MLGLVDYGSDSDGDGQEQGVQQQQQQQQRQGDPQQQAAAGRQEALPAAGGGRATAAAHGRPVGAPSGLPSAAALFDDSSAPSRLPAPYFGPPATGVGGKRTHPDTRGPLPNPMATDKKLQRSGGAPNVGAAKPAAPGGLLLPPQLRGRANVSTEDLSNMFTKESQRAAGRRSSGGGGGGSGGGSGLL